jgi:hypothetical protein
VWIHDQLTGAGHWAHPLESGFFVWLSLVPLLAFVGLLHTLGLAVVVAVWPRAANRGSVVLGSVALVPVLTLAGRSLETLTHYAAPLAIALVVYALASRIPGSREPPEDDPRTSPLGEDELLGRVRTHYSPHSVKAAASSRSGAPASGGSGPRRPPGQGRGVQ